jgi:hypothetical protein
MTQSELVKQIARTFRRSQKQIVLDPHVVEQWIGLELRCSVSFCEISNSILRVSCGRPQDLMDVVIYNVAQRMATEVGKRSFGETVEEDTEIVDSLMYSRNTVGIKHPKDPGLFMTLFDQSSTAANEPPRRRTRLNTSQKNNASRTPHQRSK